MSKWHLGGLVSVVYVTVAHTHIHTIGPPLKHCASCKTQCVCQTETTVSNGSSFLHVSLSLHRAVTSQVATALPRLNSQVPSRAVCHRNGSIWKQTKGLTLDSTRSMWAKCLTLENGSQSEQTKQKCRNREDNKCQCCNFPKGEQSVTFSCGCQVQVECSEAGLKEWSQGYLTLKHFICLFLLTSVEDLNWKFKP